VSPPRRRRAYRFGLRAETAAAWALRLKGYRIVGRRYRSPVGEIDLIARRGGVLAFVEVKARRAATGPPGSALDPAEVLGVRQRRRLVRAARAWLARPQAQKVPQSDATVRFDLIVVMPRTWPRHIAGAWTAESVGLTA